MLVMIFQWEFYVNKYQDLNVKTMEEAWDHWNNHGKKEERIYNDISIFFDWKNYLNNNKDLYHINNEDDAWRHFLYYGNKENRIILNKEYLKIYCV